jgi:hypothetical protein
MSSVPFAAWYFLADTFSQTVICASLNATLPHPVSQTVHLLLLH